MQLPIATGRSTCGFGQCSQSDSSFSSSSDFQIGHRLEAPARSLRAALDDARDFTSHVVASVVIATGSSRRMADSAETGESPQRRGGRSAFRRAARQTKRCRSAHRRCVLRLAPATCMRQCRECAPHRSCDRPLRLSSSCRRHRHSSRSEPASRGRSRAPSPGRRRSP